MTTVSESDWAKGISLSVLASILGSASKLAIRKSWLLQKSLTNTLPAAQAIEEEELEINDAIETAVIQSSLPRSPQVSTETRQAPWSISSYHRQRLPAYALRFGGMLGMTIFNPLCCVVAMNYASPSILAPFSGLTLVWIIGLSDLLIHEPPTRRQVQAAVLIIAGEVIVSLFGDHTNDANVSVENVRDSYFYAPFQVFLVALVLWMTILSRWMKGRQPALKRFAWGVAGGSVTGLQNFLKDALIVIKDTHFSNGARGHLPWWFFLLVLLAVCSAFAGLLLLTACMKRYDVTYTSAMFVGSFIASTSIMSVAHYGTFEKLQSTLSCVMYPVGLLVLMSGVWMLVLEAKENVDSRHDDVLESLQVPLLGTAEPFSLATGEGDGEIEE